MISTILTKFLLLLIATRSLNAFSTNKCAGRSQPKYSYYLTKVEMASGRGWGNDDFLSSLSGNDEEREQEVEKYNDYKNAREEFDQRQRERLESPAGKKFMQKQREMMAHQQHAGEAMNPDTDSTGDFFRDLGMENFPSEGGSRFANMIRQASDDGMRMSGMGGVDVGFVQKLAIPLSDDEDEFIGSEE